MLVANKNVELLNIFTSKKVMDLVKIHFLLFLYHGEGMGYIKLLNGKKNCKGFS